MKQMTDNPNPMSEERGWQLLWLITGLFAPSKDVHTELIQFLNTRRSARTSECLIRLNKTMRLDFLKLYRLFKEFIYR
jgi:myosin-7